MNAGTPRTLEVPTLVDDDGAAFYVVHVGPWRCTIRWAGGLTQYPTPAELEDLKRRHRWHPLPTEEDEL